MMVIPSISRISKGFPEIYPGPVEHSLSVYVQVKEVVRDHQDSDDDKCSPDQDFIDSVVTLYPPEGSERF